MSAYLLRRLLLMIPTVWGILTITFIIIQFVPGGPLDQMRDLLEGRAGRGGEAGGTVTGAAGPGADRRRNMAAEDVEKLRRVYHLDRPLWERYGRTFLWFSRTDPQEPLWHALSERKHWDGMLIGKFGDSFYRNRNVLELIVEKMPVSLSLGVWSFILSYPLCVLLGVAKAVRNGSRFDVGSSILILVGYSIPGFVLAVLLIVLLGPGDAAVWDLVPLSGLTSAGAPGYESWSFGQRLLDYFHHLAAPLLCLNLGALAVLTGLT
ncbi:MAG: microcin ABC transporter permease, partial [bacterium]